MSALSAVPGTSRWRQRLTGSLPGLALLLAAWLLATLSWRPLLLPDEGRYAGVAREMLHGDGWVPLLNGLPFFHKPPLAYWIDMGAMRLLGETPAAARIAPALGGWLMALALLAALRRWHGPGAMRAGALVLATSPFFFLGAQYVNHDMLVAGCIAATVLAFARAVDGPKAALRWVLAGWALAAAGVLAKGLIGVVLPALVLGPWLLARGRWRSVLALLHPAGIALFLALAAPWFVAMQQRYPAFWDYFFVEQHFRRYAQAHFNNVQPWWFYVAVIPLLTLPWSLNLPRAARWAAGQLRPQPPAEPAPAGTTSARARLGLWLWWIVAVVAFFSAPRSKIVGYVLPALPAWSALLALALRDAPRRLHGFGWAAALLCVAAVALVAFKAPHSRRDAAQALAQRLAPGDRVVMVDAYFYDLPFYARLAAPVVVAGDWDAATATRRDDWRKELFDTVRFDPARGQALLWPMARLAELPSCASGVWFVADPAQAGRIAEQLGPRGARREYADALTELWYAPRLPSCD